MPTTGRLTKGREALYDSDNIRPHIRPFLKDGRVQVAPYSLKAQCAHRFFIDSKEYAGGAQTGCLKGIGVREIFNPEIIPAHLQEAGYAMPIARVTPLLDCHPELPSVASWRGVAQVFDDRDNAIYNVNGSYETYDTHLRELYATAKPINRTVTSREAQQDSAPKLRNWLRACGKQFIQTEARQKLVDSILKGPTDVDSIFPFLHLYHNSRGFVEALLTREIDAPPGMQIAGLIPDHLVEMPELQIALSQGVIPQLYLDVIAGKYQDSPNYGRILEELAQSPIFMQTLAAAVANNTCDMDVFENCQKVIQVNLAHQGVEVPSIYSNPIWGPYYEKSAAHDQSHPPFAVKTKEDDFERVVHEDGTIEFKKIEPKTIDFTLVSPAFWADGGREVRFFEHLLAGDYRFNPRTSAVNWHRFNGAGTGAFVNSPLGLRFVDYVVGRLREPAYFERMVTADFETLSSYEKVIALTTRSAVASAKLAPQWAQLLADLPVNLALQCITEDENLAQFNTQVQAAYACYKDAEEVAKVQHCEVFANRLANQLAMFQLRQNALYDLDVSPKEAATKTSGILLQGSAAAWENRLLPAHTMYLLSLFHITTSSMVDENGNQTTRRILIPQRFDDVNGQDLLSQYDYVPPFKEPAQEECSGGVQEEQGWTAAQKVGISRDIGWVMNQNSIVERVD